MNYDEFVQQLIDDSLESFHDDECGEMGGPVGWNALFTFDADNRYAGAILTCDSQGFYSAQRYCDSETLIAEWEELVEANYYDDELDVPVACMLEGD